MSMSVRDNLLVTMGARAEYMNSLKDIALPGGLAGEDLLAEFVVHTVDTWLLEKPDYISFDEYVEKALINRFPPGGFENYYCSKGDLVKTLVNKRDFDGRVIPKGTIGVVSGMIWTGDRYMPSVSFGETIWDICYLSGELQVVREREE